VLTISNSYPGFQLLRPACEKILNIVAAGEAAAINQVSVIVTDDIVLNRLKKQFFQEDVLTDTISFQYHETGSPIDGEVYLSLDRIKENAQKYNNNFKDELVLVLIHSFLHLIGYDDQTPTEKKTMNHLQQSYQKKISIKGLFKITQTR
jgi:probable rRNA maturation factor